MFPESGHSIPLSASFTDPLPKAQSPGLGKQGKISSSPKKTPTHRGKCSYCSSLLVETESVRSVHNVFCTGGSFGGETPGRQQETKSH